MIDIKSREQFQEVIEQERILIDFYADWCGPCKMMEPIIEEVKEIEIGRVNIDELSSLAREYKILSIPSFKIFEKGRIVKEKTGFMTREEMSEFIK